MGCGGSKPEPEPVVDEAALKAEEAKKKKAEEAAKINAQIAAKMAEKGPVEAAKPFERKFDGFKRHENRKRHDVKRTGAGADTEGHHMVRKSEVERIKHRMEAAKHAAAQAKHAAYLQTQKTMNFLVHLGDNNPDHAHETLAHRITRNLTRRSRATHTSHGSKEHGDDEHHDEHHDEHEPQHGHGLRWSEKRTSGGGLTRALTRRFTRRGRKSEEKSESKLFSSGKPLEGGLDAYDESSVKSTSSKVSFGDATPAATKEEEKKDPSQMTAAERGKMAAQKKAEKKAAAGSQVV